MMMIGLRKVKRIMNSTDLPPCTRSPGRHTWSKWVTSRQQHIVNRMQDDGSYSKRSYPYQLRECITCGVVDTRIIPTGIPELDDTE